MPITDRYGSVQRRTSLRELFVERLESFTKPEYNGRSKLQEMVETALSKELRPEIDDLKKSLRAAITDGLVGDVRDTFTRWIAGRS